MGLYGFKKRFESKVASGEKRHTIRAPRKNEDKPGNIFYGYVGLRTKAVRKIIQAPYVRNEPIVIEPWALLIEINGSALSRDEADAFALADGFESLTEMMSFWSEFHIWEGLIHHWDFERRTA